MPSKSRVGDADGCGLGEYGRCAACTRGITGGLSAKPTKVDAYFQQNYFPNISDPVILEVRRERSIELALEGFRFTD